MSTTIDERVLEMRFDNRQFENNVSTTMSTLDKLKQKLNFTGASKGLESVNAAAKNVNMTGLGNAVETVSAKFSALQVMGVTALANITNSAVNAGKRIVSALTIDPIKTGLSEYETKINAIQVIRANTRGKNTMDEITAALAELNDYADRTIYNFAQMTDNVGKFVAQGLDVNQATNAIQGLANLAGASGASAQDMARATYQMSQALGGVIRKIDWNSLRNANMATVELKNTLMDIARVRGIDIDEMIADKGTFEDTLEKGWLTGELFTEAMNIYSDVYSEAELKAKGFTDEQIKNFKDLAQMAREATTEVKTFSQLWDVLKETAQSGWTQTWELIFGDFDTSKRLFTDLQVYFSDIINGWSDARNTLLKNVLNPSETLESIFGKLGNLGEIPGLEGIKKVGEKVTDITDKLEKFQEITHKVWRGDYGNGSARIDLLTKAGYNAEVIQELVNKGVDYKLTVEDIEAAHKKFGVTVDKSTKSTKATEKALEGASEAFTELSDEQLRNAGLTEDEITLYRQLQKESKRTGRSIEDLVEAMSTKSGRELLIDSIKNAWTGLVNILKAVKDAWYDVFSPISAVRLYTIIESIEAFSQHLRDNEEVAESIGRTFRGVFAALDIAITVLSGPFKFLVKIVSGVLKALGVSFLDITAKIGDGIVKVRDGVDAVIGAVSGFIADHISKWINKFKELEIFKSVGDWFKDAGETIGTAVDNISEKIGNFNASSFMDSVKTFGSFLSDIGSSLTHSEIFMTFVDGVCSAFDKLKNFFGNFKLPDFNLSNLSLFANFSSALEGSGSAAGSLAAAGAWVKNRTVTKAKNAISGMFSMNWDTFKATAMEKFASFWMATGDKIKAAFEKCKEVLKAIAEFIFGTEEINLPVILDVAQKFLGLIALIKVLKLLNTLSSPLDNITDAIDNLAGKLKWEAIGAAFKSMALALGTLTVCIIILASMPDMGKAWDAMKMLGIMLVTMAGVIAGLMFMASKMPKDDVIDIVGVALSMLALVGTIYLLTQTLQKIDQMSLTDPVGTFTSLGLMLLGLSAGIKIIAAAGSSSFKSVAAILTLVSALNLILGVITTYDEYDWTGKADAIWRMAGMLIILSTAINIASRGIKSNAGASGLAMLLLAMVFSLKILLGVMEDFAAMDTATLLKGGAVVAALFGVMAWMMIEVGNANQGKVLEKGQKSVNNFVGLATALLAVVASIWLLGKMATKDTSTFISGGMAVAAILLMFTGMISAIGKSCSGLKMGTVIVALVGMGLLIAEVAIILNKMRDVPWEQSLGSAAALGAVLLAMAAALKVLNKSKIDATNIVRWIGALAGLTLIVGALAEVLSKIDDLNPATAVGNATALSGILFAMAGCLTILTKHRNRPETIKRWVLAMAGLGLVVAELAFILYSIKSMDPISAIGNATALGLLLAAMATTLGILSKAKIDVANVGKWIGAMAGLGLVVSGLAFILYSIKEMNPKDAVGNAVALGILATALSISLIPLAFASKIAKDIAPGIVGLVTLAVVLGLLVAGLSCIKNTDIARENAITLSNLAIVLSLCTIPLAAASLIAPAATVGAGFLVALALILALLVNTLSYITDIETARENAKTLANLAVVLSLCTIPLAVASVLAPAAIVGAGLLVALAATLGPLIWGLSAIKDTDTARANTETIILLLESIAEMIVSIGALGINALTAVGALKGIISLVTTIGILAVSIGALSEHWDGLSDFIDTGLELLKKLARGLGEMLSEFGVGLSSGLPEIATNLSNFAYNLLPFVVTMNMIEDDVVTRAENLAKAIAALAGGSFLSNLSELSGNTLSDLGTELSTFAWNMTGFSTAMTNFKPETVTAVESLCAAINALTEANLKDAWTQILPGDNSLSTFGAEISGFATSIKDASTSLAGITEEDVENIKRSAAAGKALAELNSAIPAQGGWADDILGAQELSAFGQSIIAFADCLVKYSAKVSEGAIDADAVTASAAAGKSLAELNGAIPTQGGWADVILGAQDLAAFGQSIVAFADCLVKYSAKVSEGALDADAITQSATAAEALAQLNGKLPSQNGLYQAVAGEKNLGEFGTQLVSFADGIVAYANAAAQIDEGKITAITNSGKAVDELVAVVDKIPTTGGWGDAIFGSADGQSFGDALYSMATGIARYCDTAATIGEDDIEAIKTSKTAVTELGTVLESAPETSDSQKAATLLTAVTNLMSIGSTLNALTAAAYDYSGLGTLKTQIGRLKGITEDVDAAGLNTSFGTISTAVSNATGCAKKITELNGYSYEGISRFKAAINSLKDITLDGISENFSGSGEIVSAMSSMVSGMASAISDNVSKVTGAMESLAKKALSAVKDKAGDFKDAGKTFVAKLASGITDNKSTAKASGAVLAAEAVAGAGNKYSSMVTAGNDLGSGLVAGIQAKWDDAWAAGYTLGAMAVAGEKAGQASNSPSKLTIQAGKWLGEGLVIGMERMGKSVYNAGADLGRTATKTVSGTISRIADAINTDIDAQPTIRPVLDLSDVRSGAATIGNLFDTNSSVGVMANLGTVGTMMSRYGQNGGNNDVVSAIDKLRKDLGNIGNTYNYVDGVTYDDGSNIAAAVKTITRVARMERRI